MGTTGVVLLIAAVAFLGFDALSGAVLAILASVCFISERLMAYGEKDEEEPERPKRVFCDIDLRRGTEYRRTE